MHADFNLSWLPYRDQLSKPQVYDNVPCMKLGIIKERAQDETRVAASPEIVKKFATLGFSVMIEKNAGLASSFSDDLYKQAGATIAANATDILKEADILLKVQPPFEEIGGQEEYTFLKKDAVAVGHFNPTQNANTLGALAKRQITSFALEWLPRITRAQSMDVLSSQSNLAGYKAVIDAVAEMNKAVPMMMTAAGTVKPAKALILGAGVAGLQAIATAKRLGAVVSAFDVRPAVKEQVQSLGAKFIEVASEEVKGAETKGGYAKEMSEEYKRKQQTLIHETIKEQDIVITTALIPGKPAPVLIPEEMVKNMKPGAVIVDLAVASGGNCPLSEPGKSVVKHGVKIIGYTNIPGRVAQDASALYARNLFNFVVHIYDKESRALKFDLKDEIIAGTLLTYQGKVVHPALTEKAKAAPAAKRTIAKKAGSKA